MYRRYNEGKLIPLKEIERNFLVLAGEEDDEFNRIIYVVSENTKVDNYLLNDKSKKYNATLAIEFEENIYVLGEDKYIYVYSDYVNTNIGKKHNTQKVKTYKIEEKKLKVTYEDGTTESLEGYVYSK